MALLIIMRRKNNSVKKSRWWCSVFMKMETTMAALTSFHKIALYVKLFKAIPKLLFSFLLTHPQ
jgi:hypothetical protein